HYRRHRLHDRARSTLRHEPALLVFLDWPDADRDRTVPSQRHSWRPGQAAATPGADIVTEPALRTEGLHKSFGSLNVASDIAINLPRGARHALIGPNGAGKTTL